MSGFDPLRSLAIDQHPAGWLFERDCGWDRRIAWVATAIETQASHVRTNDATTLHGDTDIAPAASRSWKQPDRKLGHSCSHDHSKAASLGRQDDQLATAATAVISVGYIHERFQTTVTVQVSFRPLVFGKVQRPFNKCSHRVGSSAGDAARRCRTRNGQKKCDNHHRPTLSPLTSTFHPKLTSTFDPERAFDQSQFLPRRGPPQRRNIGVLGLALGA